MDVKYPEITVQLSGRDGNAWQMVGRTRNALRQGKVPHDEIEEFATEALSGDYDHVLQTIMAWVDVE